MLESILTRSGRFVVDITENPEKCDAQTLARYDVVLSNWNTFGAGARVREWPSQMRLHFLEYVRNGGGFVVVHAGGTMFHDWAEFHRLIGGAWGEETGHGSIHTFEVQMTGVNHPITRGLSPFKTTDELWHKMAVQPEKTVLATAFSSLEKGGSGQNEPVAMVVQFGEGRCFNLVLGHDVQGMNSPGFQTLLLRGTEWAATGEVKLSRQEQPETED
jgi:uncharacterized protein